MTMTIYENGHIAIDGQDTGLGVTQRKDGTVLYRRETASGQKYLEIRLPEPRYSLAHEAPASGNPGRAQFEADLRRLLDQMVA